MYPINCRIVSAINEDPRVLMDTGKMRSDLFYRIAPLSLYIPPLRERPQDILAMARYFIGKYNKVFYKDIKAVSPEMERLLLAYDWPGNVRELDYVIENMMIRAEESELKLSDLPRHLQGQFETAEEAAVTVEPAMIAGGGPAMRVGGSVSSDCVSLSDSLQTYERELIETALLRNGGNQKKAAEKLGISRQNLYHRMRRLEKCKKYDT